MGLTIDCAGCTTPADKRRGGHSGDDRVGRRIVGGLQVFYLADGATGIGRGAEAADAFVEGMDDLVLANIDRPKACADYLREIDEDIAVKLRGEADTTGILLVTDAEKLWGASVGDSAAWLFGDANHEITGNQARKPRLGSGALPVSFGGFVKKGDVVVAGSDGLWNYLRWDAVEEIACQDIPANQIVEQLEAATREENDGKHLDDFGVVVLTFR